jgi:hypothetical protein
MRRSVTKIEMTTETPNPSPLEKKKNIEPPELPSGNVFPHQKFKLGGTVEPLMSGLLLW